jgi:hypothetical protein
MEDKNMKTRKFMLCKYPAQGFGSKSNQYYLMNQLGTKFDIVDEYDKVLDEMNKVVRLGDGVYDVYCESSIEKLIEAIEERYDTKIERW